MNFSWPVPRAKCNLVDIAHHLLKALRLQAGGVIRAIHGAVEGQVALDDAGAQGRGHRRNGDATLVTGITHRHAEAAQLVHKAQVDILEGSRVGAVAVQQGKFSACAP